MESRVPSSVYSAETFLRILDHANGGLANRPCADRRREPRNNSFDSLRRYLDSIDYQRAWHKIRVSSCSVLFWASISMLFMKWGSWKVGAYEHARADSAKAGFASLQFAPSPYNLTTPTFPAAGSQLTCSSGKHTCSEAKVRPGATAVGSFVYSTCMMCEFCPHLLNDFLDSNFNADGMLHSARLSMLASHWKITNSSAAEEGIKHESTPWDQFWLS